MEVGEEKRFLELYLGVHIEGLLCDGNDGPVEVLKEVNEDWRHLALRDRCSKKPGIRILVRKSGRNGGVGNLK